MRAAARAVAEGASSVHLSAGRAADHARSLPVERLARPEIDARHHFLGRGDDTVAFFLVLDAVNFGSGWFPHLRKPPGLSGYFTIASALTRRFEERGAFTPDELVALDARACAALFGQDPDDAVVGELMALFARALGDLGRFVQERFGGSFTALVESAGCSAERLVAVLTEMPLFDDVSAWRGRRVPFYKRAQITAADLALAFDGRGPGRFDDLDRLTIFADNLVPHVLRLDGVLRYEPELLARIEAGELLAAGSEEEVEIRACAVHAVELMVAALHAAGRPATAMAIDQLLWSRGQQPRYKARPRHRARSTFY